MGCAVTADRVLAVSITDAGSQLADRLPYEHVRGELARTIRDAWSSVDAFVLFCATGVAVRIVGPLLADKARDPAVVCIDEAGRYAVALCGGHAAGANDLARHVAAMLDAEAVVTTATDAVRVPALDDLAGFVATGDVAGVARAWLDGRPPLVERTLEWPVPFAPGDGPARVLVTDHTIAPAPDLVVLHPPSLVVGIGASTDAPVEAARTLLDHTLAETGLAPAAVGAVGTIDRRAADAVVTALGLPVRAFDASTLASVDVPNPSEIVAAEVGTPSVAEAAALAAAGEGAELVVTKRKAATVTLAIARRARPEGSVSVVGLGPGHPRHRTGAAIAAIRSADVVIGYELYVDQCGDLLRSGQVVIRHPIGAEADRCRDALTRASDGARVALVCSGDAGVFAMAGLVHELAAMTGGPCIEVLPGVTAASAAAALLGAPLAHDHAYVSLSDLLTPWAVIEKRLRAIAVSDLAVALYNPRSSRRTWQLEAARSILLETRPPCTPVGVVADASRPGERVDVTTLEQLDCATVDMLSLVIVGSSTSFEANGRIVTPRGYEL
jgi:cobalt-precorrin 5A hydrolase/precorrin-3B C17-methyltransferase